MPKIKIDGIDFNAEEGWTVLDVAKFLGIDIPTLCHYEGLSPSGSCRLCIVEIGKEGEVVASCTRVVENGLIVRTSTKKIIELRKIILELLIAQCPTSKTLQDLASKIGLKKVRFTPKYEDCINCGLCVRICDEQMSAKAIGFVNRGNKLKINSAFNKTSEECRRCGACIYICPVCNLRCGGIDKDVLCNSCYNEVQPTCLEVYDNYACWMGLKMDCGSCVKKEVRK